MNRDKLKLVKVFNVCMVNDRFCLENSGIFTYQQILKLETNDVNQYKLIRIGLVSQSSSSLTLKILPM